MFEVKNATEGWRNHTGPEKKLYISQNITKGMRLAGHIAGVEAVRNACTAANVEAEWENQIRSTITVGRIQIHLKGTGCDTVYRIYLFEELRAFGN